MVFSSIPFLFYFLPIFLLIYYIVPFKLKNFVLLLFSLIFYAWGEPIYISLLVFSSIVDYCNGRFLEKYDNRNSIRKVFLIFSIIVNLSLLGIFKYSSLLIDTFASLTGQSISYTKLALPIGISFFTFQTMSYSIDVYRREVKAEHNFIDYMAYVSMFPQLIAGPIVRYETVSKELHKRDINFDNASQGCIRFLKGLFKKVLIANQVGQLFDATLDLGISSLSITGAWLGGIAYALQIYFDFSGYSDMAIGLGKMLGFNYLENFNYPYISSSITEFWRRWHISLSGWFKDYIYIPLGGNRCKLHRNITNILIVWALTGIWHGASWNYMLWGIYFAILLLIEKYVLKNVLQILPAFVKHILTLILLIISWVIFAIEDFSDMITYIKAMFGANGNCIINNSARYNLSNYYVPLIIAIIFSLPVCSLIHKLTVYYPILSKPYAVAKYLIVLLLFGITLAFLVNDSYNPFLYFRF